MTVQTNTCGNAVFEDEEYSASSAGPDCTFRLWDYESNRIVSVTFVASAVEGVVEVILDRKVLRVEIEEKLCLAPSKGFADFSVSVYSGRCSDGNLTGTMLVVVNCGQVVPTLQISLLAAPAGLRSWCLRIDHVVQQRVLEEFNTIKVGR